MGNSTIIELNHDQCDEIEKNPEKFVQQIKHQLATMCYNGKEILGGKVIVGFHRSEKIYESWCKWKKKYGN